MPFFMNPFGYEFKANWSLVDHHAFAKTIISKSVPPNKNNSDLMVAFNAGPYDFSSLNTLTINYAVDPHTTFFTSVGINVAGVTAAATTATEVANILNLNATFSDYFVASTKKVQQQMYHTSDAPLTVEIKSKRPLINIRAYISNSGAESIMKFNKYAGIKELPAYFSRFTIENRDVTATNSQEDLRGHLIELDGTDTNIDRPIIREFLNNSSWTNSDLLADWQHLKGQGGRFLFKISTVNADGQPTETILWSAGAVEGDMGVKITQVWGAAGDLEPVEYYEEPYLLTGSDVANTP